jgi:hypothetical protein
VTVTPDITPEPGASTEETPSVDGLAPVADATPAPEPETFPAEHVAELRDELAKKRIKAKERDADANARLLAAYATADGRLIENDVLALSDDLLDEAGFVDPQKVGQAIGALVEAKPYLAARRPTAALPLGVQQPAPDTPGLFGIIKRTTG